jgi:hypothetical protein
MVNPDPAKITDPMWRLWTDRPNSTWLLSGIYADKKGYHNTVNANLKNWPGTYSIETSLDLVKFNRDKARAIDLTMSDFEMVKWTTRMRNSALNPADNRLMAVREFYGTLDNTNVFGLIKDSTTGVWRRSSADATHLWHGHVSIFTSFVNNWTMLAPLLSVWSGETFFQWKEKDLDMFCQQGDSGEIVKYWQSVHNTCRETVTPPAPEIVVDGTYGAETSAAFKDFVHKQGGQPTYTGASVPYWLALRYHTTLARVAVPQVDIPTPPVISEEQLKILVNSWLTENVIPTALSFEGSVTGKVTL